MAPRPSSRSTRASAASSSTRPPPVASTHGRDSATRSTPTNTSHRVEAAAARPHRNEDASSAAGGPQPPSRQQCPRAGEPPGSLVTKERTPLQREDRDDPGELAWRDRLLEVVLEPCAQDAGPLLRADDPGEGGRGCRAAALGRQGANLADEPAAAPARHLQVTHEDIWALALHRLERIGGRGHSRRGRSVVFEHRDNRGADVLTVVNHEDPYTTQEQPVMRRVAEHRCYLSGFAQMPLLGHGARRPRRQRHRTVPPK